MTILLKSPNNYYEQGKRYSLTLLFFAQNIGDIAGSVSKSP